jgi:2-polyprenyl-6-methoxyphenol hydroxylase-like FAD-dependent oxidoreductase
MIQRHVVGAHAVVIGGSMTGLWAARVLADGFERVTVVERDRYPAAPGARRGVPQACHVHVLLTRGQRVLDQLFPGIDAELASRGAPAVDWGHDCLTYFGSSGTPRVRTGLVTRPCSRDLLEWSMRDQLRASGRITFLEGVRVTGLAPDAAGTGVSGVQVRAGEAEASAARDAFLAADLVVDASGRASRAPDWLMALGYGQPPATAINSHLGYASRIYRRPPGHADWQALFLLGMAPSMPRGGVIYPIEDDRWLVTLAGTAHQIPPTDEAGFLAFAGSLASPVLHEAIRDAQPITPIRGYRRTENRWRHFERMRRWPEGFVVLGDAVCAFNPVYGQGMTTSALGALTLDACLRRHARRRPGLAGLARRCQQQVARVIAGPWLMATGEDFRWPSTTGGRPDLATRAVQGYVDQVFHAATTSPASKRALQQVMHMVAAPRALFRPAMVLRVVRHALRRRAGRPWPAAGRAETSLLSGRETWR